MSAEQVNFELVPEAARTAFVPEQDIPSLFRTALEHGFERRRSVTLYVGGQVVSGRVVRFWGQCAVELTNPQFDRLIIDLRTVAAVAVPDGR